MTKERYYAHKHLLQKNKVYDKICHNFMSLDETVEHMNNQYWKYKQLKEENEKLKQQVEDLEFALRTELAHQRVEKKGDGFSDTVYDFEKKLDTW